MSQVTTVAEWLREIKLTEYASILAEHGYTTLESLQSLTDELLTQMGIRKLGHRQRMLRYATAELSVSQGKGAPPASRAPPRPAQKSMRVKAAPAQPPPLRKAVSLPSGPPPSEAPPRRPAPPMEAPPPRPAKPVPKPRSRTSISTPQTASVSDASDLGASTDTDGYLDVSVDASSRPDSVVVQGLEMYSTLPEAQATPPPDAPPALPPKHGSVKSIQSGDVELYSVPPPVRPRSSAPPPIPPMQPRSAVSEDDDDDDGAYALAPRLPSMRMTKPKRKPTPPPPFVDPGSAPATRASTSAGSDKPTPAPGLDPEPVRSSGQAHKRCVFSWLEKKGGRSGTKGWDTRWCVYDNGCLKYYIRDTDQKPQGTVPLTDMVEVNWSASQGNRFDLVTQDRTYYFRAKSTHDQTMWMNVLGAAIALERPLQSVGGTMSDPDKAGTLKQANGFGWSKRYLVVKDDTVAIFQNYEDYKNEKPLQMLNAQLINVQIGLSGRKKRNHQFTIRLATSDPFEFQAESEQDRKDWVQALNEAIQAALDQGDGGSALNAEKALGLIRENPDNCFCADCHAESPVWVSLTYAIPVCLQCSGMHRNLGVHLSKVRSATMDGISEEILTMFAAHGSKRSNAFWEGNLKVPKLTPSATDADRLAYITAKYRDHEYAAFTVDQAGDLCSMLFDAVQQSDLGITIQIIALLQKRAAAEGMAAKQLAASTGSLTTQVDGAQDQAAPAPTLVTSMDTARQYKDAATGWSISRAASRKHQKSQVTLLEANQFVMDATEAAEEEKLLREEAAAEALNALRLESYLQYDTTHDSGSWTDSWAVLDTGILTVYSADGSKVIATLPLDTMASVAESSGADSGKRVFTLRSIAGKKRRFAADSPESCTKWIKALKMNIDNIPKDRREFDFENAYMSGHLIKEGSDVERFYALGGEKILYAFENDLKVDEINLKEYWEVVLGIARPSSGEEQRRPTAMSAVLQAFSVTNDPNYFSIVSTSHQYIMKCAEPGDAKKWVTAIKATQVFGASLDSSDTVIPPIVDKCCEYIETTGLLTEGIYRVAGNVSKMRQLEMEFNRDDSAVEFDPSVHRAHDVASLLKLYFRRLPEPIICTRLRQQFFEGSRRALQTMDLAPLQQTLGLLPYSHLQTLKFLIGHLSEVVERSVSNKMTTNNIALVFGPTLCSVDTEDQLSMSDMSNSYKLVEALITHYEPLFGVKPADGKDALIREGLRKLEEANLLYENPRDLAEQKYIYEVSVDGEAETRRVIGDRTMTAQQMVDQLKQSVGCTSDPNWAIFEITPTRLTRYLEPSEQLIDVTSRWRAGDSTLCLRRNTHLPTLQTVAPTFDGPLYVRLTEGSLLSSGWKKCHCVSDGNSHVFAYYKGADSMSALQGDFALESSVRAYFSEAVPRNAPAENVFVLQCLVGDAFQTLTLAAETPEDASKWVAALTKHRKHESY
eukprot:m.74852 g.74852  ORF g.74852 m.74852 type:complete len:1446 (-) comp12414_c1_seq1:705-5042(-)